jgi:ribonuclease BN (tRNA processing enzyme)
MTPEVYDMKLIILGSGTCVPSVKRNAPGYYLEAENRQILIDCGSGTLLQLEKLGKSYKDIDAVFITHPHPDHIAGLMPLIHALLATPLFKREKTLSLIGPKGFKAFYQKCIASILGFPRTFSIQIIEIENEIDYPPFHVLSAGTIHSENSIAFRFEYKNKSIVITGDADYDNGIIELSKNSDILIADCSFPESMKASGHMTPQECGLVAKKSGAKKLVLSHLHTLPFPDACRLDECNQVFKGDVILAEDFLEFML